MKRSFESVTFWIRDSLATHIYNVYMNIYVLHVLRFIYSSDAYITPGHTILPEENTPEIQAAFLKVRPWWRHQMETFSALLAICAGNSPVLVNSTHRGQWRGALVFSLICAWINGWVNNREADDLRRHRGHYDVNIMTIGAIMAWGAIRSLSTRSSVKQMSTYHQILICQYILL